MHEINFWELNKDTTCTGGFDGETWTLEAIENGKYNLITRWLPHYCGNETTNKLAYIGFGIIRYSKILEILSLKTGEKLEKDYFGG